MSQNSLAAFAVGFLIADWQAGRAEKKERLKNEAYQRDPSANPGEYFKRQGWLSFENLEAAYGKGKTAESVRKEYEGYLKLKAMKPEERAARINNPELLAGLNEMSFATLKKRRDEHLTNLVFFKNNSEKIARAYGIYNNTDEGMSDEDAKARWIGVIFILVFMIAGLSAFGALNSG